MPRLIAAIVRHGAYRQLPDTPSAHQPFPLVAAGEQQAREAAAGLRRLLAERQLSLFPQVDSSQLLRAWQTAQIMLQELTDLFPQPPGLNGFDELAERSVGSAANLSIARIEAVVREDPRYPELPPDWKSDSRFRLPLQGAESLLQAGERVAAHLRTRMSALAETARADTLKLFVGHGAAFRHAAYHLGVLAYDDIKRLSMHHARPVLLEYRPEGPWRHVGGEWKMRGENTRDPD
jgi:2,3-bisphosphoglycerate-dependent phosphoglycerate mutase